MRKFSTYTKIHRLIAAAVMFIILIAVICEGSLTAPLSSYAESSTVSAYESQNILDDLDGSTIAGKEFNLNDYPYDENGRPQVLNLVEFCYSIYSKNQDDFGIYLYVYNPEGYAFDDNSDLNQAEMTIGSLPHSTYALEIVNYSTAAGYEGLFYKFKVVMSDSLKESILSSLTQTSRVYTVVAVELAVDGETVSYEVGTTYTYSGYSLGYGSSAATESTLTCNVDGFDNYLTLDVTHTTYRSKGDYYEGEQSQLDSVYFTVPNEYFENYGELTTILCEYYEYITKPMLVTENAYIYNAINSLYGRTLDNISDGYDYLFYKLGTTDTSFFGKSSSYQYASNLTIESGEHYSYSGYTVAYGEDPEAYNFENFGGVFYTGGESYNGYSVSAEEILAKLKSYSEKLGDTSICGKYAAALFDSDYEGAGYSGLAEVNITDTKTLFTTYTTKNHWWQKAFGGYDIETDEDAVAAFAIFSDLDMFDNSDYAGIYFTYDYLSGLDSSAVAELFKIGEGDVSDFLATCKQAEKEDETVVLMRFASSTYISQPCAQSRNISSDEDSKKTMSVDCLKQFINSDYSAYVFQETVYLNFDIISLTFTLDDVETIIPVAMTPVDLASDSTPPLEENYGDSGLNWKVVFAIVALVLLCVLCAPILPYVAKFIVWIISLPVKMVRAIAQAVIKSAGKHKKE